MSTGKVILGTLTGLAIGALAGILFAPQKGSTTRKQIFDKGDDYVDKIKSKFDEFSNSLTEKFNSAKNNGENLAEKGKAKYYDAKRNVKNETANFKHDVTTDINHATS